MLIKFIKQVYHLIKISIVDKKIIILNTPLQLINFIEYKNLNLTNKNTYKKSVILISNSKKDELKRTLETNSKINNDIIFNINSIYLKFILFFILKIRSIVNNKLDHIVIGDFNNSFICKITNFSKKVIILDDGTNIFYLKNKKFTFSKYIFFSFFNKKYFNIPYKFFIENQYTYIKNLKKSISKQKKFIILLGSPFVSKSLLDENQYIECLQHIKKKYIDKKIFYFPHPKENINDIAKLKLFKIIKSNYAFEIYLLNQKVLPDKIIGLNSTAFITIYKLFNNNIILENYFYYNDNKKIFSKNLKFQKKIINYFSKYLKIPTKFIKL